MNEQETTYVMCAADTINSRGQIWDYTADRIDDMDGRVKVLDSQISFLTDQVIALQTQLTELMKRSGMRCESLL